MMITTFCGPACPCRTPTILGAGASTIGERPCRQRSYGVGFSCLPSHRWSCSRRHSLPIASVVYGPHGRRLLTAPRARPPAIRFGPAGEDAYSACASDCPWPCGSVMPTIGEHVPRVMTRVVRGVVDGEPALDGVTDLGVVPAAGRAHGRARASSHPGPAHIAHHDWLDNGSHTRKPSDHGPASLALELLTVAHSMAVSPSRCRESGRRRPCCFNLSACTDPDLSEERQASTQVTPVSSLASDAPVASSLEPRVPCQGG
jgi:hypothetical protein